MEIWYYWALAALLLVIIEIFTVGFAVICLAIGAGGATIAAACELSLEWQFFIFAVVSLVALVVVRPILKRLFFRGGEKIATNANAMINKVGVVCVDIDIADNGRVMVEGMDWRAKSADGEPIAKDTKVIVTEMDSITLIVKKL